MRLKTYYRVLIPLRELAKHDGFDVHFTSGLQTDRLGQPVGGVYLSDMAGVRPDRRAAVQLPCRAAGVAPGPDPVQPPDLRDR